MMTVPQRRLARLALVACLAGAAVTGAPAAGARAGSTLPGLNRNVVASWGSDGSGQLGDGNLRARSLSGRVNGIAGGIVQVAAGWVSALALTSDGTVLAWGSNGEGQLGNGTTSVAQPTPVQVIGLTGVTRIAEGTDFSLALRSDGTVWAWGGNDSGQLGDGTISNTSVPVQVAGLTGVTKIAAGDGFSLALRSDGTVWAWGDNVFGELGNGTGTNSDVPVQVKGLLSITSIAAGGSTALAVRTLLGSTSVFTWGIAPGLPDRLSPVEVGGIGAPGIAGIAVGGTLLGFVTNGTFSLVLGTDGSVWAWGANSHGQLGIAPTSSDVTSPVMTIGPGSGITQLAAGMTHTLALRSDGTVLAWGDNGSGELGDGSTEQVSGPVQVSGLTAVSQVVAAWGFSLAIYVPPLVLH